ncbi:cation diffusion facilitator family transporter [Virgibacillus sp. W0430]|uniref:cation diffusion facilitator family transporter n=1 Tax=Virgibacillus sp. W0430 TaxID=3391580 RepID=UPI003F480EF7
MEHVHGHAANKKALIISFIITTAYMIIEAVGGFLTNSLALLSDAGHMLSDSISLGVGAFAFIIGEKLANDRKTYGYKRIEILAALFNGVTLTIISFYIFYEAYHRFVDPPEVASFGMLTIAIIGLIVNVVVAWILNQGETEENLNLRAAFLHVLGDLFGSIGAIIAAIVIMTLDWSWADPLASVFVAILVLISGWRVTKDAFHILMEGTPKNINLTDVVNGIENVTAVYSIHDLHVWSITSSQHALSCHVVVDGNLMIAETEHILRAIEENLQSIGITHVTIQLEAKQHPHDDSLLCNVHRN